MFYFASPCIFLSLRNNTERISMKFAGGSLTTTANRLNVYILDETGTGTDSRVREKIRIGVNRFRGDVKQVLTPSE